MATVWTRINTALLLLLLVSVLGVLAMLATDARGGPLDPPGPPGSTDSVRQPGTPISSAPFTISSPGHYYLTRNLSYTGAGSAISISASNVTLDLGGFSLLGSDTAGSRGIFVTSMLFPISVENGIVRDFDIGVDGVNGSMVKVKNVTAFSNGVGILVGNHTEISQCTVGVNSQQGIRVVGSLGRIQGCLVFDSALAGIQIEGSRNLIESNRLVRNDTSTSEEINIPDGSYGYNIIRGNFISNSVRSVSVSTKLIENTLCSYTGNIQTLIDNHFICA